MNDRELLELAAKAAGIELHWSISGVPEVYNEDFTHRWPWCPLTDDGDALRLAVTLGLALDTHAARACYDDFVDVVEVPSFRNVASIRRAIVRAAAEIALRSH